MSRPHQLFLWLQENKRVGDQFKSSEVPLFDDNNHRSSACNHLEGLGLLKVINKLGHNYVYEVVTLDAGDHTWRGFYPKDVKPGVRKARHGVHMFKKSDFQPSSPTGRVANHLPEMQRLPSDDTLRRFREQAKEAARLGLSIDFSVIEQRILSHVAQLTEDMPKVIGQLRRLALSSRVDLLSGFSDDDLLAELKRRGRK